MKKICIIVLSLALVMGLFTGCGLFKPQEPEAVEVSTYDELVALSGENVKLTADIDCEDETLPHMIICRNFDGNGHKISNFTVNETSKKYAALFDTNAVSISNLTVENATIKCSSGYGAAVIVAGGSNCTKIDNVHVKKATISIAQAHEKSSYDCYVGGIYAGRVSYESKQNYACEISNCSVDKLEFSLSGVELNTASGNTCDIYGGGIAGRCAKISNCAVTNSTMSLTSVDTTNIPYLGGLAATVNYGVDNSYVKGCTLSVRATHASTKITDTQYYWTSDAYLGGLVANTAPSIQYSYAQDNKLTATCSGDVYVGGIAGTASSTFTGVYAVDNTVTADVGTVGSSDQIVRGAGGLIGAGGATLVSCFSYNNTVTDKITSGKLGKTSWVYVGGLVGRASGVTALYCAVGNNTVSGLNHGQVSSTSNVTVTTNCFVTGSTYTDFEVIEEEDWLGEGLKEKLNLVQEAWQFADDALPSLDIKFPTN